MLKNNSGFTLIELAMVLFIITLVLGSVMSPLSTRLQQSSRKNAEAELKEIKASLLGYALINGNLPCPDCPADAAAAGICGTGTAVSNDGIEDGLIVGVATSPRPIPGNFTGCAVQMGNLPWSTLGVTQFDPWGNPYVYSVAQVGTVGFADNANGTGCGTATAGISFELCSTGDMTIVDTAGNNLATNVPAMLLSYGANGQVFGGIAPVSATELDNWWTDVAPISRRRFVSGTYIQSTATQFDDQVIWITAPELMYRMVNAELLP